MGQESTKTKLINPFSEDSQETMRIWEKLLDERRKNRSDQFNLGIKSNEGMHQLAKTAPYSTSSKYKDLLDPSILDESMAQAAPVLRREAQMNALKGASLGMGKNLLTDVPVGIMVPEMGGPSENVTDPESGKVIEYSGRDTLDKLQDPNEYFKKIKQLLGKK